MMLNIIVETCVPEHYNNRVFAFKLDVLMKFGINKCRKKENCIQNIYPLSGFNEFTTVKEELAYV